MIFKFFSPDAPQALGRKAQAGDDQWGLVFGTDDGGEVTVYVGRGTLVDHVAFMLSMINSGDPALLQEVKDAMQDVVEQPQTPKKKGRKK